MTDKLPAPCEHCHATGISNGSECTDCGGKGYRLMINGQVVRAPTPAPGPRAPWRNPHGPNRSGQGPKGRMGGAG